MASALALPVSAAMVDAVGRVRMWQVGRPMRPDDKSASRHAPPAGSSFREILLRQRTAVAYRIAISMQSTTGPGSHGGRSPWKDCSERSNHASMYVHCYQVINPIVGPRRSQSVTNRHMLYSR